MSGALHRSRPPAGRPVLVLVGPTASGKTPVAIEISRLIDVEIISADSRQMYKHMDIGTAKPSREERARVPHHFVDDHLPDASLNASEFGRRGREIIDDILSRGKLPLVVGGSGLYVQGLIDGFFEGPEPDEELRAHLYGRLAAEGGEALLEELRAVDPVSAQTMLPSNSKRIVRALEIHRLTGQPISELQKTRIAVSFTPAFVGLRWERAALYERINRRVDRMLEGGLVEEARQLLALGYDPGLNALQTVGYREVFEQLRGACSHERMVFLIKRNSRRYAKRQMTWFRHDERIAWFDVRGEEDFPAVAAAIVASMDKKVF
jgi:tRNA dimethylallyltransferase